MKVRSYSLKQFPSECLESKIRITGKIVRHSNTLSLSYELTGPLADIIIPARVDIPSRKYGLWEETCFEFFVCAEGSDNYREFNLSPAGHWNVYRFTSYRLGMQEEPAFLSLPFSVRVNAGSLCLSLELDLEKIFTAGQALKVAVGAVIKNIDGKITYWALAHPGPQPDFHRRESFIVEV
ncbi:MAG: DOMON-like domain-containing protein [Thermodesulfovibrionales bacterium]